MADEKYPPAVQAAILGCLRAAIALAATTGVHGGFGFLPHEGKDPTDEERALREAIQQRATAQNITEAAAEKATLFDYMAFYRLTEVLHPATHKGCPAHTPIPDFCHGTFGGLYGTLHEGMGMTPHTFLEFMNEQHRRTSPDCRGFTATETALQGCRADRLPPEPNWV